MDKNIKIEKIIGRQIIDSRGNPTVEAEVFLSDGSCGRASVPSGASTGIFEAKELRDEKKDYNGKSVYKAVENINQIISKKLVGEPPFDIFEIDKKMIELDCTPDKSKLGANTILAVSLAVARAAARHYRVPLYRYLGGISGLSLPRPMMNILNGGAHASNNVEIQEFMIVPVGAECFADALKMGSEIYHHLGNILKERKMSSGVGDEGGYAPDLHDDEEALDLILEEMGESIEIRRSYKLNERHYGALQGLNKSETAEKYGEDQVKIWRRSFDVKPPELNEDDERSATKQAMYRDVDRALLPKNESLETTIERVIPFFEETIKPDMKSGKRVIIAAHGNSLRALVKYFDNMSPDDIVGVNIPTAVPLVYEFDDDFNVIKHYYLGDQEALKAKMEAVANQGKAK